MNETEIWKEVVGYDNYEVSNLGNIRSKNRIIVDINNVTYTHKLRPIKQAKNRGGYYQVPLRINGKSKTISVHRLVAEAFIDNPENKPEVNHKDGDKSNCNVFNLEWNTHAENLQHAARTGLLKNGIGIDSPLSKTVIQLNEVGNILNKFNGISEAYRKTGINYQNISSCCLGRRKSAGGYYWKFLD
jgi:hypothetical protein